MADEGYSAQEILQLYYTGVTVAAQYIPDSKYAQKRRYI